MLLEEKLVVKKQDTALKDTFFSIDLIFQSNIGLKISHQKMKNVTIYQINFGISLNVVCFVEIQPIQAITDTNFFKIEKAKKAIWPNDFISRKLFQKRPNGNPAIRSAQVS